MLRHDEVQAGLAGVERNSVGRFGWIRHHRRMGALDAVAARVAAGTTVEFRPSGTSMVPLIRSRQLVAVAPVDPSKLGVGDIVLARVAGTVYLHLVSAVDPARKRVQISNNRGHVNGWTSHDRVFGICVAVDGVSRSGSAGKVLVAEPVPPMCID
ncbi:S26 family signal peptidase [Streptomyces phaeofaciens]